MSSVEEPPRSSYATKKRFPVQASDGFVDPAAVVVSRLPSLTSS